MAKRFMIGDRVTVEQSRIRKAPLMRTGTIVARKPEQAALSLGGGFRYVLLDGEAQSKMAYVGRMAHLDPGPRSGPKELQQRVAAYFTPED